MHRVQNMSGIQDTTYNTDLFLSLGPRLAESETTDVCLVLQSSVSSQNGPLALETPALALAPVKNRVSRN